MVLFGNQMNRIVQQLILVCFSCMGKRMPHLPNALQQILERRIHALAEERSGQQTGQHTNTHNQHGQTANFRGLCEHLRKGHNGHAVKSLCIGFHGQYTVFLPVIADGAGMILHIGFA